VESIDYYDAPCLKLIEYKEKKEVGFSGLSQKHSSIALSSKVLLIEVSLTYKTMYHLAGYVTI
jgi:hypothetical protein